jgi:hypothetical protein
MYRCHPVGQVADETTSVSSSGVMESTSGFTDNTHYSDHLSSIPTDLVVSRSESTAGSQNIPSETTDNFIYTDASLEGWGTLM